MTEIAHDAAAHYDRVVAAWQHLLGDELHYGLFAASDEPLPAATRALTERMIGAARLAPGLEVLDVGCGTGAPACTIATEHGVSVLGIATSRVAVDAANERAENAGLGDRVRFEVADGQNNGLPDASVDRVWVLESSHLMPQRDRLIAECARVLRPGGRIALCDIVRRREMNILEIRARLHEFQVLRAVFGEARMDPLADYRRLMDESGLVVDVEEDLTSASRLTFDRWRDNAHANREIVTSRLGANGWAAFVESCDILTGFWDDGTLGYGIIAAGKPA